MLLTPTTKLSDHKRKQNGVVYTPHNLASYVATKVVGLAVDDLLNLGLGNKEIHGRLNNLRIIDPACGEGELLTASWKALIDALKKNNNTSLVNGLKPNEILCGIDIDETSIAKTKNNIDLLNVAWAEKTYNLFATNALFPEIKKAGIDGWKSLKQCMGVKDGFDVLIANPPWGASTSSYEDKLSKSGFVLNKGQSDTSDLFIESALSLVKTGGYFAFIIPDSLFGFERKELRKLLLDQTEIKFIGRLGEKIFEGVNRACGNIKEYRNCIKHSRPMNNVVKKQGEASLEWIYAILKS